LRARRALQAAPEAQRDGNLRRVGEARPDRGGGSVLERGDDEPARAENVQRELDQPVLVAGLLQVQVALGPALDQREDVRDPRYLITSTRPP